MAHEQSHDLSPRGTSSEIDRIRDIIFGRQMQEYEEGFQAVRQELLRLEQEISRLRQQLADQDEAQNQRLQQVRAELQQADEALHAELQATAHILMTQKVDRAVLGEWLIQMGSRLKTEEGPAPSETDMAGQESH